MHPSHFIQAAMIVSGVATLIQVSGFRIGPIRFGSGLLSVMGITLTSTSVWQSSIQDMMAVRG
jgi:xanthine/uracil permease